MEPVIDTNKKSLLDLYTAIHTVDPNCEILAEIAQALYSKEFKEEDVRITLEYSKKHALDYVMEWSDDTSNELLAAKRRLSELELFKMKVDSLYHVISKIGR